MEAGHARTYVWCTYRDWSFRILEEIQGLNGWRAGLIVAPRRCTSTLAKFEARGIPVLRVEDPAACFREREEAFGRVRSLKPQTIFHYGWSWMVPTELLRLCPNVTLHPGKLPKDRGGSPLQHQIRNGETWTYANILKMTEQPDAGPVYLRERISLEGTIDEVWTRMTATGCLLTRTYLTGIAKGDLSPTPQAEEEPTVYRRVKPEQAELKLDGTMTAAQMHNIIRAHSETDANTYVRAAYFVIGEQRVVIDCSSLGAVRRNGATDTIVVKEAKELLGKDMVALSSAVTEGKLAIAFEDRFGDSVYVTSMHVGMEA